MTVLLTLAEVGDKVAKPGPMFLGMLILWILFGTVAGALGRWRWWLALIFVGVLVVCAGLVGALSYFFWDIVDDDLLAPAVAELGPGWIWQCRVAAWCGTVIGLTIGVWAGWASVHASIPSADDAPDPCSDTGHPV